MPLDHYIPQVHLRNFYSLKLGNMLHAIRKFDLQEFPCRSRDVCRIMNGNTNSFLKEPRIIEEFLKGIEPKYNTAIHKLRNDDINQEVIYVISRFICYVQSIAPAYMRIHSELLKKTSEMSARVLDAQGKFPPTPDELGNKSISELLSSGEIYFQIDGKYPQALGVDSLLKRLSIFGNSHWEILLNIGNNTPFFTSDYPVAVERSKSIWYIAHRVIGNYIFYTPLLYIAYSLSA
jgi:hypothetical protein